MASDCETVDGAGGWMAVRRRSTGCAFNDIRGRGRVTVTFHLLRGMAVGADEDDEEEEG